MKPQREVGVAKQGMNKDIHVTSLNENSYIHALNANFQGQDGDSVNLQNEESNILCSKFVEGFHVIGVQHDNTGERTYFFLTNPTTRESEIGYIADLENQISFTDTIQECDCDIKSLLSSGLESVAQVATCTYVTLIADHGTKPCQASSEGAGCLGFNVNYPISSIIKQEKCGDVLYFTDDLNPRRRVEVAKPEQYNKKTVFCDDDTDPVCDCGRKEVTVCFNCDKLNILPSSEKLCIDILGSVVGGKTRHGQYLFFAGYCDSQGNLVNNYVAASGACSINDENREVYQQFELDTLTNLSIKLKINNLDPSFDYYKVAVLQRNAVDGAENAFVVDILPTSTSELLYSGSQELQPIDARELVRELPDYLTAKTVTQANNQLFFSDLEARPDPNLQPVVNFMGQFAKWRTAISEEGLYKTTRGTGSFKGYMRDEVVPFGIRFVTNQGYKTPVYPLIPRVATDLGDKYFDSLHSTYPSGPTGIIQVIANATSKKNLEDTLAAAPYNTDIASHKWINDVYSVLKNGNNGCANEERIYKWQFYNTATNEGPLPNANCSTADFTTVYKLVERICITEKIGEDSIRINQANTDIRIEVDEDEYDYTTFFNFVNDRQEDIRRAQTLPDNQGQAAFILSYLLKDSYKEGGTHGIPCCEPGSPADLFDTECSQNRTKTNEIVDFLSLDEVNGATPVLEEIPVKCEDISRPRTPNVDNFIAVNSDGDPKNENSDEAFVFEELSNDPSLDEFEFWVADRKDTSKHDFVFRRTQSLFGEESCTDAPFLATNYEGSGQYPFTMHISPQFPQIDIDTSITNHTQESQPAVPLTSNSPFDQIEQLVYTDLPAGFGGALNLNSRTAREGPDTNLALTISGDDGVNGVPHWIFREDFSGPIAVTFNIPDLGDRIKKDNCYQKGDLFEGGFFAKNETIVSDGSNATPVELNPVFADNQGLVHRNAIFYKVKIDTTKPTLVLTFSNLKNGSKKKNKKDCLWYPAYVRVSLFTSCRLTQQNNNPLSVLAHQLRSNNGDNWEPCDSSGFIDENSFLYKIGLPESASRVTGLPNRIDDGGIDKVVVKIQDSNGNLRPEFDGVSELIIAVDAPLVSVTHMGENKRSDFPTNSGKGLGDGSLPKSHTKQYFYASGTWGMLNVKADYPPVDYIVLKNGGDLAINLEKTCVFETRCPFKVYEDLVCNPVPFEYGNFSYWESTLNYPNNNFLYDSKSVVITEADIPPDIRTEFQNVFTNGAPAAGQPYVLSDAADFSCKPIRHFKFPDFNTAPAFDQDAIPFKKNNIFPIGVHLDNEVIEAFLNIAVNNNYITQEFRDSITHYEIFRGDTKFDRSVIAKGLLYDMYQYPEYEFATEDSNTGNNAWFSNFPYNDLSTNKLLYQDEDRTKYISHPFRNVSGVPTKSNYKYTFHSPETSFDKPILPFEMYVESHFTGQSRGSFVAVKNHPVFTVLSPRAHRLARILSATETAFEIAALTTEFTIQVASAGGGVIPIPPVAAWVALAIFAGSTAVNSIPAARRRRVEWEEIFYNRGERHNFAYYYSSVGYYNQFSRANNDTFNTYGLVGDKLRGLKERLYLKDGRYRIDEAFDSQPTVINNTFRESSVFLSLGSEVESAKEQDSNFNYSFNLEPPSSIKNRDNSRYVASDHTCVNVGDRTQETTRGIATPYVSLKQFIPNQHGNINDLRYIYTSYCGKLGTDNSCDIIYGGDTFINRFYLKRKFPFFLAPMIDGTNALPDLVPFNYQDVRNIGYPKYYLNYRMSERDENTSLGSIPNMISDYKLDCFTSGNKYIVPPSKFYLYYYGIPGFMVESAMNLDFRYGENETDKGYYPAQSDFYNWTQESTVPIREDNKYYYWNVYSTENDRVGYRYLPDNYDPAEFNCRFDHYDRTIYSLPDTNEQDLLDNYRVFLANNFYDFGSKYGPLKALHSIESAKVLGLFENGVVVFNAYSTIQATTDDYLVGNAGIFANRPQEYFKSDLGYGGTQHTAFATCQYGHFWVDAKRGRIYSINPGGAGMQEISQNGLGNWFRENLPFRIKKQFPNISDNMIDNPYEGLGISMVWDDRYSRLFVTKLDAKVKSGITIHDGPKETLPCVPGGSITIDVRSYSPITKSWVSFHSFLPNYYVAHNNYFSSGLNFGSSSGIWNHLLGSNQTFQVYYGTLYPWIIEVPVKQNYNTRMYEDFSYRLDVRRYSNEYDYHYFPENFDTAVFYNDRESTGLLNLITQKQNNQQQLIELPKFTGSGVDILATKSDYTWSVNFFLDNLRENHTLPIWNHAVNNVGKSLNATAFNYQPTFKNHIRGQYLIARLSQNNESRLKYIFEHFISDSLLYDAY